MGFKRLFLFPDNEKFEIKDTIIALVYYCFILVALYFVGRIYYSTGKYWGSYMNAIIMLIPVILCFKNLSKTGITKKNLLPALLWGSAIGVIVLMSICIVPGIIHHWRVMPGSKILNYFFYYFIIIALSEEISFRGFIQPRLFPVFKKEWLVILVGGILFVLMHYPFQMTMRGMSFADYWPYFISGAPFQFLWHLAFTFLYRKFGNIWGGTMLHGFVDMSQGIFF